jgi:ABC-type multidrug transport system fused ATPase/permease subunit
VNRGERLWTSFVPTELRWLASQIRPLFHWHFASFLCITSASLLALLTPLILKWLIDGVIPQRRSGTLVCAVGLIFLAHQGKAALNSFGSYLMLSAAQKLGMTLRLSLLRHLDTLSSHYYEQTPIGAVMYPFREPIDEISYFGSDLLPAIVRLLLTLAFTLVTMFVLSPILTLTIVPFIPVFLVTRHYYRKKLTGDADRAQRSRLAWSDFLQEHLSAAIPIQLLGQECRQERRAFILLARAVRSQQKFYRTAISFALNSSLTVALAICAVIGYGGAGTLTGRLSIGTLVAFYGFVTQLFDPLSGAAELYARAQKIFSSVRQVQSAFALVPTVANAAKAVSIANDEKLGIRFHDVEFVYPGQKHSLRIPALQISPGEEIVVAGENGAGKSTMAKLIARLQDPTTGSITIGREDIRNFELKSLRKRVCYLPRDPVLFDGTIASNLRFVRPSASETELNTVLGVVGLSFLIASLPDGLRQRIGPDGSQLSGGERQCLAIARSLLQYPRILILDEATCCLHPSAEGSVLENVRAFLELSTLIVVSHRPAVISPSERVLLLSDGRVIYDGGGKSVATANTAALFS